MYLKANQRKFKVFLKIAKELNKQFNVKPVLFGSLGIYRSINKMGQKTNDVDILLPEKYFNEKSEKLELMMNKLGFVRKRKGKKSFDFILKNQIISFSKPNDLVRVIKSKLNDLKETRKSGAVFKEVLPLQYLSFYEYLLKNTYRQKKRKGADRKKIEMIKKYLKINER